MKIICLGIMIFLILNSFQIIKAQDIKTYNYELTKSNDTVRCGFYLKPSYPNPFGAVYNVYFGMGKVTELTSESIVLGRLRYRNLKLVFLLYLFNHLTI
jgi:hypothetical protein